MIQEWQVIMKKITWDDIVRKLTSRKLWVALGGFVSLVMIACGCTESAAAQAVEIIMAAGLLIAYIVGEGMIDAANKKEDK